MEPDLDYLPNLMPQRLKIPNVVPAIPSVTESISSKLLMQVVGWQLVLSNIHLLSSVRPALDKASLGTQRSPEHRPLSRRHLAARWRGSH
jgi:hypothetical protein